MVKTNLAYSLQVEVNSGVALGPNESAFIPVNLPFTIEFQIDHNILNSSSSGNIRIYNLSKVHRDQIRKDLTQQASTLKRVTLNAGYGNQLSNVLVGDIMQAWSVREGNNFITSIDYVPGLRAIEQAHTSRPYAAGTTKRKIIKDMFEDLKPYGITPGGIGAYSGTIQRGNSYNGNTCSMLDEITEGGFSIYNGNAYAMKDNEYVPGALTEISPATGLINTPVRQYNLVSLEMIFEPRVVMRQKIELKSFTDNSFDGEYTVVGINHKGMISPTVAADCTTRITLGSPQNFTPVQP